MSAAACARAASGLTAVAEHLGATRDLLLHQRDVRPPEFDGLAAVSFRLHVDTSAATVADLASRIALLAAGLAALGRALAEAERLDASAATSPPGVAAALRSRAADVERRAQAAWRQAVSRYGGAVAPSDEAGATPRPRPPATPTPVTPPVAPPATAETGTTGVTPSPGAETAAPVAAGASGAAVLTASLVVPTVTELVDPPDTVLPLTTPEPDGSLVTPPRCGTAAEVGDGLA